MRKNTPEKPLKRSTPTCTVLSHIGRGALGAYEDGARIAPSRADRWFFEPRALRRNIAYLLSKSAQREGALV